MLNPRKPREISLFQRILLKLSRTSERLLTVKFDRSTGMYYYSLYNKKVFVKYRHDLVDRREHLWKCREIYFNGYQPKTGDVVVDLGAGYGEEAAFLANEASGINYFGFEILPSVY